MGTQKACVSVKEPFSMLTFLAIIAEFGLLQNDISEKEQRWGAKTIEGSGRAEHIKQVPHGLNWEFTKDCRG